MRLVITVDTEADNQWDPAAALTVENLSAVPRLQSLCDEHGFPPTYLCTYEVLTSPVFERAIGTVADAGRAEVGAHLHPWSTPPFDGVLDGDGAARPYPCELPRALLADKLQTLTTVVGARSGRAPTSYRAGRWGFSETQIPILTALRYEVDCSVTPGVSWRHDTGLRVGGPDFTGAGIEPYELAAHDVCRPGDSGLLEVPVTILHTSRPMRAFAGLRGSYARHRRSLPWRIANRLFQVAPQWLRPFPHMTAERLIAICELARRLRAPVLEMTFHSSELLPGASPYNPTPATVDELFDRLSRVLAYLASTGVRGATLTEYARSRGVTDR